MTEISSGPFGYENWLAHSAGTPTLARIEFQLYSDASFTNELWTERGPYKIYNAFGWGRGSFGHTATLAVDVCLEAERPDFAKPDTKRYSGLWIGDEIAALAGLLMGIRLRAGGVTREFGNEDQIRSITADRNVPPAPLRRECGLTQIPHALEERDISVTSTAHLVRYTKLPPDDAVALVKAARLYEDALWVSETQPELAWLLFASAVETVAVAHQAASCEPIELLKSAQPNLYEVLATAEDPELLKSAASTLTNFLKATNRFITFLMTFRPKTSADKKTSHYRLHWESDAEFSKFFSVIYNHRSSALHDGKPFPPTMCEPVQFEGSHCEMPPGLGSSSLGGVWDKTQTPMLLHVFEYICRESIKSWWWARSESALP